MKVANIRNSSLIDYFRDSLGKNEEFKHRIEL